MKEKTFDLSLLRVFVYVLSDGKLCLAAGDVNSMKLDHKNPVYFSVAMKRISMLRTQ